MEPILTTIISALVAGAVAKAKDVASQAVSEAYQGLKSLIVRKLGGKSGAVQSIEDDPDSESAQASLAEVLAKQQLHQDAELKTLADRLERAVAEAKQAAVAGSGDIEIASVRGKVNATIQRLEAQGRIKLGPIEATEGSAVVSDLRAGSRSKNP
jgi:hypothetical protein